MSDSAPFISVLRVWAAMAWADGKIVPSEARAMKEFISLAPIDDAARAEALSWLQQKVELDTSELENLRPDARENLYRSAVRIAALDREIAEEERAFLLVLRERLSIDPAAADAIDKAEFPAQDV